MGKFISQKALNEIRHAQDVRTSIRKREGLPARPAYERDVMCSCGNPECFGTNIQESGPFN